MRLFWLKSMGRLTEFPHVILAYSCIFLHVLATRGCCEMRRWLPTAHRNWHFRYCCHPNQHPHAGLRESVKSSNYHRHHFFRFFFLFNSFHTSDTFSTVTAPSQHRHVWTQDLTPPRLRVVDVRSIARDKIQITIQADWIQMTFSLDQHGSTWINWMPRRWSNFSLESRDIWRDCVSDGDVSSHSPCEMREGWWRRAPVVCGFCLSVRSCSSSSIMFERPKTYSKHPNMLAKHPEFDKPKSLTPKCQRRVRGS